MPNENFIKTESKIKNIFRQKQSDIIYCQKICTITNAKGNSSDRRKISFVLSCFVYILKVFKARSYLLFVIVRIQTGLSGKLMNHILSINHLYLSNNWFRLFPSTLLNVISPCSHGNLPHSIPSFSNFVYRKAETRSKWGIWSSENVSK